MGKGKGKSKGKGKKGGGKGMNEVGPYQWAPPLGQVAEGQDIWSGMSYMCALTAEPGKAGTVSRLQIAVKNRFAPLDDNEDDGDELAESEPETEGKVDEKPQEERQDQEETRATQRMLRRGGSRDL